MISVSDILKLLEQVPIWRSLVTLPKRLAELEARVAALESGGTAGRTAPGPRDCPLCGAVMVVTEEKNDPTFGPLGGKIHVMRCDGCESTVERAFEPGRGYV